MFLGLLPSFCLQSRSVVLDCCHTPRQHAQCHKTPTSHIQAFHFCLCTLLASWNHGFGYCYSHSKLVVIDKQPSTHMLNLPPHVCQLSEIDGNLAEADPHQCQIQTNPVPMAHHHIRHCHKLCLSRHDASGGCFPGLSIS